MLVFMNLYFHNLLEFKQANRQPELIIPPLTHITHELLHVQAKFRWILSKRSPARAGGPSPEPRRNLSPRDPPWNCKVYGPTLGVSTGLTSPTAGIAKSTLWNALEEREKS